MRRVLLGLFAAATALVVAVPALVWAVSEQRIGRVYTASDHPIGSARDADAVERGRKLAAGVALCSFCHGADLAGTTIADDPWIGRLSATNLTPGGGGIGPDYTDADLERAIRRGLGRDARSLLLMPAEHLRSLDDRDLADLIAYLRSVPPVDSDLPARRIGPLTRAVLVLGLSPELLSAERATARESATPIVRRDTEPGAYLVAIGSCRVCHHDDLRGGLHPLALPGEPPPPDITGNGGLAEWSAEDFRRAMREGATPNGDVLDPRYMPWPHFRELQDAELDAVFAYLRDVS